MAGQGGVASGKLDVLRKSTAAKPEHGAPNSEAEKWKAMAIMWCKRALTAETQLAIMVEGVVR